MPKIKTSKIRFANGNEAQLLRAPVYADAASLLPILGIATPRPAIFLSGGASAMSDDEMRKTRELVAGGIARFAAERDIVVVDGGTEAGIMHMMGEARAAYDNRFTLIGSAPLGRIAPPNAAPDAYPDRALLETNHSHFVLVEADYWGAESDMIVELARGIAGGKHPTLGILINGGSIAQYDVYIATARGSDPVPVLVVDGSGRTADSIASATKSGNFMNAMIRAIVEGGKIEIVHLEHGPEGMYSKLQAMFD